MSSATDDAAADAASQAEDLQKLFGGAAAYSQPSSTAPRAIPTQFSDDDSEDAPQPRRVARRRPAGPVRTKIAANDDAPSIGGLIYALDQKPSTKPFKYAAIATGVWATIALIFCAAYIKTEIDQGLGLLEILARPQSFLALSALLVPAAVIWFLALLAWRSDELRLRSSTMAEVAIRLAEPDRNAEQSVASLGQAVRRQVSFMNDAISRALGRAGELEALVHNEVSALERSYEENERKIRGLIQELSGERNALLDTSERVTDTLRALGTDIPGLIEKLSSQQMKLAQIIQGAGENLASLETAVGQSAIKLETTVGNSTQRMEQALSSRTEQMQTMLEGYTIGLADALGSRTDQLQEAIQGYVSTLDQTLTARTENLQAVFEEYALALDTTLTNRAQALDVQLVERTKALDAAFGARLQNFDEQILHSTLLIDSAVAEKAQALTVALENHAKTFNDTISRQVLNIDESLMQGINSVRRTSENITRQSLKAIEGLAGQSEMLRNVSENLLAQINTVTNRFEGQGQAILQAASTLESANYKIDATLQGRHADLITTIDKLSGKADEFGRFISNYSTNIEGSLSEAEQRALAATEQIRMGTEAARRSALADLERLRQDAGTESDRTLDDLRRRFSTISTAVNEELSTLTNRLDETTDDVRQRASRALDEIAREQMRLRQEMERLPQATRENAEAVRRSLQEQLRALDQLSQFTSKSAHREVSHPVGAAPSQSPQPQRPALTSPLASQLASPGMSGSPLSNPPISNSGSSLTGAYSTEVRTNDANRQLSSLSLNQHAAPQQQRPTGLAPQQPSAPGPAPRAPQGAADNWSLGDLLKRASFEDDAHGSHAAHAASLGLQGQQQPMAPQAQQGGLQTQLEVIARAIDPATASTLWGRINAGQRGVMVRSLYSPEGRAAFDELSMRYRTDLDLQRTVNHYLVEFEHLRREAEQRDPSGRTVTQHLLSDMGRVYLFLAHVSGRIT